MDLTKKQILWGIILFGTLIGLNETVIGSFNIKYKSVILSAITLSLFSYARYYIPRIGSTLLIMAIAVLFKLTDLGVQFCKPVACCFFRLSFRPFRTGFCLLYYDCGCRRSCCRPLDSCDDETQC